MQDEAEAPSLIAGADLADLLRLLADQGEKGLVHEPLRRFGRLAAVLADHDVV